MLYSIRLVATPKGINGPTSDVLHLLDRLTFSADEEITFGETYWWIVRDEGRNAIGFCGAEKLGEDAMLLSRVGLLAKHRGQGLQKRCIAVREAFARRQQLNHIVTYTALDNIPSANNLIKCGYTLYRPSVLKKWLHFYKCLNPELSREEIREWQKKCNLGYS